MLQRAFGLWLLTKLRCRGRWQKVCESRRHAGQKGGGVDREARSEDAVCAEEAAR